MSSKFDELKEAKLNEIKDLEIELNKYKELLDKLTLFDVDFNFDELEGIAKKYKALKEVFNKDIYKVDKIHNGIAYQLQVCEQAYKQLLPKVKRLYDSRSFQEAHDLIKDFYIDKIKRVEEQERLPVFQTMFDKVGNIKLLCQIRLILIGKYDEKTLNHVHDVGLFVLADEDPKLASPYVGRILDIYYKKYIQNHNAIEVLNLITRDKGLYDVFEDYVEDALYELKKVVIKALESVNYDRSKLSPEFQRALDDCPIGFKIRSSIDLDDDDDDGILTKEELEKLFDELNIERESIDVAEPDEKNEKPDTITEKGDNIKQKDLFVDDIVFNKAIFQEPSKPDVLDDVDEIDEDEEELTETEFYKPEKMDYREAVVKKISKILLFAGCGLIVAGVIVTAIMFFSENFDTKFSLFGCFASGFGIAGVYVLINNYLIREYGEDSKQFVNAIIVESFCMIIGAGFVLFGLLFSHKHLLASEYIILVAIIASIFATIFSFFVETENLEKPGKIYAIRVVRIIYTVLLIGYFVLLLLSELSIL